MQSVQKIQQWIGFILLSGTLLSTTLVMIGGAWYLWQFGADPLQSELLQPISQPIPISEVWHFALSWTPLGLVQLGLLLLISTQTIRVFLLFCFYTHIRDYAFMLISLFILLMLIYSSCWRH